MKTSVIIPVTERVAALPDLIVEYARALNDVPGDYEILVVIDGDYPELQTQLTALRDGGESFVIIQLAKAFGEATALSVGFQHATGEQILILPPYPQVEADGLPGFINSLHNNDMVTARRWPRSDSFFNRLQARIFNALINWLTGSSFHDLGCGVRAMTRKVMEEVPLYGDQHRFLPLLARNTGFRVEEVPVKQSSKDLATRVYRPGVYFRRALDVLTVFFLVKFTKKPLRFFGLVGGGIAAFGGVVLLVLLAQRLFWDIALADRPALLISSLIVVLGIQIFAIGLIGELIIFTHARDLREYSVEKIIN